MLWWDVPEGPLSKSAASQCPPHPAKGGQGTLTLPRACPFLPSQYVIRTVEVESSKTKQALSESQARNQHLQEQVAMQRQVLKEMEQQLQSSHQLTTQLRAQVHRLLGGAWGWRRAGAHPAGKPEVGRQYSAVGQPSGGPQTWVPVPPLLAACVTKAKFCLCLSFLICRMMPSWNPPPGGAQGHNLKSVLTKPPPSPPHHTHTLGKGGLVTIITYAPPPPPRSPEACGLCTC